MKVRESTSKQTKQKILEKNKKILEKSKKILKKKSAYKKKKDNSIMKRTKTIAASIKESEKYITKQNQIEKKKKDNSKAKVLKRTKTIAASIKESKQYIAKQTQIEKEHKKKNTKENKAKIKKSKSPVPNKKIKKSISPKKSVSKSKQSKIDNKSKKKNDKKDIPKPTKPAKLPVVVPHPPVIVRQPSKLSDQGKSNVLKRSESNIGQPGYPTAGIIDTVFCMDTTGSMGSYLAKGQQVVNEIIKRINEKVKGTAIDVKFGFVAYRDHPPQDSSYVTKFMNLDTEDQVKTFIQQLDVGGGGDGPEAVMDGLMDAAKKTKWRDSMTVPQLRYIFHICDAPPHGKEEFGGESTEWNKGCPCGITTKDIAHQINLNQIHYRLIKIGAQYLDKMAKVFRENFTNYDEQPIESANNLEIHISDMIIRELFPDF